MFMMRFFKPGCRADGTMGATESDLCALGLSAIAPASQGRSPLPLKYGEVYNREWSSYTFHSESFLLWRCSLSVRACVRPVVALSSTATGRIGAVTSPMPLSNAPSFFFLLLPVAQAPAPFRSAFAAPAPPPATLASDCLQIDDTIPQPNYSTSTTPNQSQHQRSKCKM